MGLDQTVEFPAETVPAWSAIADLLNGRGFPVQLRMIDGELAFPDEVPPDSWRELRVGTPQGMVTLRRQGNCLVCVTWGNADASLLQAWNALIWACARAGEGQIVGEQGWLSPADFQRTADLPPPLRTR